MNQKKKNQIKKLLTLIIALGITIPSFNTQFSDINNNNNNNNLEGLSPSAADYPNNGDSQPFYISGNQELEDYCESQSSSGTSWDDAYIIEDIEIVGEKLEAGIYILHTTRFLIIEKCEVVDEYNKFYSGGIFIENCSNIRIQNCKAKNFGNGIFIKDSSEIHVIDNEMNDEVEDGIHLLRSSNCTVRDNEVSINPWYGICIKKSQDTVVEDNKAFSNTYHGIRIENADNITVRYNKVYKNRNLGISISETKNSIISDNNVYDNTVGDVLDEGGENNTIENNQASKKIFGFSLTWLFGICLFTMSFLVRKHKIRNCK